MTKGWHAFASRTYAVMRSCLGVFKRKRLEDDPKNHGKLLYDDALWNVGYFHKELADTETMVAFRDKWRSTNFEQSGELATLTGAEAMIVKMLSSLGQRFDRFHTLAETTADDKEKSEPLPANTVKETVIDTSSGDSDSSICYIRIEDFRSDRVADAVRAKLAKVSSQQGVIIDLRSNPGGSIEVVQEITSYFLQHGIIADQRLRGTNGFRLKRFVVNNGWVEGTTFDKETGRFGDIHRSRQQYLLPPPVPVAILVNKDSASGSEYLAGSLKFNKRACVIGTGTFGKGVGQSVVQLRFGRTISITSFEFLPAGHSIDWSGILPDIEVEMPTGAVFGSAEDAQLNAAIEYIKRQIAEAKTRAAEMQAVATLRRQQHLKRLEAGTTST